MKGQIIQVTGVPRFGSAFMSVFFSLRTDSIGVHEAATFDPDWMNTLDRLRDKYAFVADCCTYGCFPNATQPFGPKVYVRHDPEKSAAECTERFRYFVDPVSISQIREIGESWAQHYGALVIDEGNLFRVETLEHIWNFCYDDGVAFPLEKVSRLVNLNIQRHEPEKAFTLENGTRLAKQLF